MLLVDTNVLSELLRRVPNRKVYAKLQLHTGRLAASVVTLEELRYGALLHPDPNLWRRIEREILPFVHWTRVDEKIALEAAAVRASLTRSGKTVAHYDCLIGATALVNDWVLVTRNTSDFKHMSGLQLANWFV